MSDANATTEATEAEAAEAAEAEAKIIAEADTRAAESREVLCAGLERELPLSFEPLRISGTGFGLVVVDEVRGFVEVGCGPLAPVRPNAQIDQMVERTDKLAREFTSRALPALAFLDCHEPGKPEPPYPPHCERGSGQDELVAPLKWFERDPRITIVRKECINGYIGAVRPDGGNTLVDWIANENLTSLLVVGICTDICVMDFVLTLLSARNRGFTPPLEHVFVAADVCSTYDLPREQAERRNLPAALSHPQNLAHHIGLYCMAARGARLTAGVEFAAPAP